MEYTAPACDFYDDGLVHSHHWASSTPPGGQPTDQPAATHTED